MGNGRGKKFLRIVVWFVIVFALMILYGPENALAARLSPERST